MGSGHQPPVGPELRLPYSPRDELLGGSSCSCALAGTELARTVRG